MELTTRVHPPAKGEPLLDYLTVRFSYRPKSAWRSLILAGHVRVNGEKSSLETKVSAGDTLTTTLLDAVQPEADFNYTIIYEDSWLIGINKPANLRVHGRGAFVQANLIYHLRHERNPSYPEALLVNRLDADTSGVVVIARDTETLRLTQELFRRRSVRKSYLALVEGVPSAAAGVIDRPLGRVPGHANVYRFGSDSSAVNLRPAVTHYKLLEVLHEGISLLEVHPLTGRTHQIRAHLTEIGHPIIGDMLYRLSDVDYLRWCDHPDEFPRPRLARQALHCAVTELMHPHIGGRCRMEAPLWPDMLTLLENLRKSD